MNWLQSEAINLSYVARLLYGNSGNAARKKMSLKVRGIQNWTEEEKEKLEEIRKKIVSELNQGY